LFYIKFSVNFVSCIDIMSSSELDHCHWKSGAQWHFAWTWSLWQPVKSNC